MSTQETVNTVWDVAPDSHTFGVEVEGAATVTLFANAWNGTVASRAGTLTGFARASLAALSAAILAGTGSVGGVTVATSTLGGRATRTLTWAGGSGGTFSLDDGDAPAIRSYARDIVAPSLTERWLLGS